MTTRSASVRAKLLTTVSVNLELIDHPITDFVQQVVADSNEAATYTFVGHQGRAQVTGKQLVEFRYCKAAIIQATDAVPKHIKPEAWQTALRQLIAAKRTETLDADASAVGDIRGQLLRYFVHVKGVRTLSHGEDRHERSKLLSYWEPFLADGAVWFSVQDFLRMAADNRERVDRHALYAALAQLGSSKHTWSYDRNEHRGTPVATSASLWQVPSTIVAELWPGV